MKKVIFRTVIFVLLIAVAVFVDDSVTRIARRSFVTMQADQAVEQFNENVPAYQNMLVLEKTVDAAILGIHAVVFIIVVILCVVQMNSIIKLWRKKNEKN